MAKKYVVKKGEKYWPSKEMKKIAWVNSNKIYKDAEKDPIKFWEERAREGITWEKEWGTTYEEKLPYFKWFKGGKLNFSFNCLDRHLKEHGNKVALIWVPEPTKEKTIKITYKELHERVCRFANVLKNNGIKKGDRISIYLPMVPEALVAMLACTRIGAVHSVVFSAFSADALKSRIQDGQAKILITADGYYRRGKEISLLEKAEEAAKKTTAKKIIVVSRLGKKHNHLDFNKELKKASQDCKPEIMNSEDMMFILYTSGTTGKPKGVIHDTGGYAVQSYFTAKWDFNLRDNDVFWCTADVGWVTGHTYAFYGPLLNASTTLIYEGSPDFPDIGRWWKIIQNNKVNVLYTAPTAIRMFMKADKKYLKKYNLDSLKILGSVGEPIDKEAWLWYFKKIGGGRCPIVDTWWQTETGGTLITALPGVGPFVPTVSGKSFPGVNHIIVDNQGRKKKEGDLGFLVQKSPFSPGMLHGVYKNKKKYIDTYWRFWTKFKKRYYDTSDGAFLTKEGLIRITGRTDDVMKVAGHRLSTAELESAINEHKLINETAVVPIPDKIKGEVPIAFAILKKGKGSEELEKEIKGFVDKKIGPTARPAKTYFVKALPKTRSGKIMRRILKALLVGDEPKGLSTLLNPKSVDEIRTVIKSSS
jgi:acetyl-CoA synthetase